MHLIAAWVLSFGLFDLSYRGDLIRQSISIDQFEMYQIVSTSTLMAMPPSKRRPTARSKTVIVSPDTNVISEAKNT
jgi:hypothetical protein